MMDVEGGRCRRTDGRKWRCSKSVVPNQKYCQGHMHRGRQGSRKHVETVSNNNGISYVMDTECDFNLSYRNSVNNCSRSTENRVVIHKEVNRKANVGRAGVSSLAVGKNSEFSTKISRRKQSVTKSNYMGLVSPTFALSPNSVLHCAAGNVGLSLGSKNVPESERQRCRRTDGKKWQCRQDAVPGEKYCEAHMHRGAKRLMVNPKSSVGYDAPASTSHSSKCLDNGINLNTIPASPEGNNFSSSPSDATTITDENISFCLKC